MSKHWRVRMQAISNRSNILHLDAELDYARALGFQVDRTDCTVDEADAPASLYDGDFPWRRDPYGESDEPKGSDSHELGQILQEAVSNHNDVNGVAWRLVACEVAKAFGIILVDVAPSTGLPRDLSPCTGAAA